MIRPRVARGTKRQQYPLAFPRGVPSLRAAIRRMAGVALSRRRTARGAMLTNDGAFPFKDIRGWVQWPEDLTRPLGSSPPDDRHPGSASRPIARS